jgi:hypothetical protein
MILEEGSKKVLEEGIDISSDEDEGDDPLAELSDNSDDENVLEKSSLQNCPKVIFEK